MLPWLSNSVLRYVVVLTLGWLSLGAMFVATTGAVVGNAVPRPPAPHLSKVVQIDGIDPCINELIVLDTHVLVDATSTVEDGKIRTDGDMTITGWVETGTARADRNVAATEHFSFSRTLSAGTPEPVNVLLTVVDRPSQPVTLLAVRLQGALDGSNASLAVTDTHLVCA
jgi:hypothetical protein